MLNYNFKQLQTYNPEQIAIGEKLIADTVFLVESRDSPDLPFILHLEFQSTNDLTMHIRMLSYFARLTDHFRKQNYKIAQFLIYFGTAPLRMHNQWISEEHGTKLEYSYTIIDTNALDGAQFLESPHPDVQLFGLLSDLSRAGDLDEILEKIIQKFDSLEQERKALYFGKLAIAAYIRDFDTKLMEVSKKMGIIIDPKELPFGRDAYLEGKAEMLQDLIKKHLTRRFSKQAKKIDKIMKRVLEIKDIARLESLFDSVIETGSLAEFEKTLEN